MYNPENENPRIETGYAFTQDMNDAIVENFKFISKMRKFKSLIFKIKNYNPTDIILQHIATKRSE